MTLQQVVRIVRAVELLPIGVIARARMIATDDEMRAAIVLPNDGVPHSLAWTSHPHGERQERQHRRLGWVGWDQRLVAANPGVVIHVARLRHPHTRVDEKV